MVRNISQQECAIMGKALRGATSTIATGAPFDGRQPMFETNLSETLGIRKFLEMSMADLRDQVQKASRDPKISPKQFKQIKAHATILIAWMVSALEMVDNMLAEAKAHEPVQESPKQ